MLLVAYFFITSKLSSPRMTSILVLYASIQLVTNNYLQHADTGILTAYYLFVSTIS